ncbi:uncharacterized protein LOC144664795 [Oculina patagonica]
MGFSYVVAICFTLFACHGQMEASVNPADKKVEARNLEEFYLHITESGTTFAEKIEIDEENDLEYLHVPAHNQVTEAADYLYDFKNDIAVRRVESKASCFVGPLPDDLPKPADLKTELQGLSRVPPFDSKVIVQKYWVLSERVDKTLFRQEVQQFCGQFPIYSLQEVDLNSTSAEKVDGGRTRIARDLVRANLTGLPFCEQGMPSVRECHPEDFVFTIEIREKYCTWWLVCQFDKGARAIMCDEWDHKFNSMVCYSVSCPKTTDQP